MSSEQVKASAPVLLNLAESIVDALEKLRKLNDGLSDDLGSLGKTFQDEGYMTVKNYVTKASSVIADNTPHATKLADALIDYAQLIFESEKTLS